MNKNATYYRRNFIFFERRSRKSLLDIWAKHKRSFPLKGNLTEAHRDAFLMDYKDWYIKNHSEVFRKVWLRENTNGPERKKYGEKKALKEEDAYVAFLAVNADKWAEILLDVEVDTFHAVLANKTAVRGVEKVRIYGSEGAMIKDLKSTIGLHPRQYNAYLKQSEYMTEKQAAKLMQQKLNYRAQTIARTERTRAISYAQLEAKKSLGKELGIPIEKYWSTVGDKRVDKKVCERNGNSDFIALDKDFPSGHGQPPGHPRCRCALDFRVAKGA